MKRLAILFILCIIKMSVEAQKAPASSLYRKVSLYKQQWQFQLVNNLFEISGKQSLLNKKESIFFINKDAVKQIVYKKPKSIELLLPFEGKGNVILELFEQPINTNDNYTFGEIGLLGKRMKRSVEQGVHFRGCVKGDSNSVAALSVFSNGDVMILFSNAQGNFNIGKRGYGSDEYVLYNSGDMTLPGFACYFNDEEENKRIGARPNVSLNIKSVPLLCKKVRFYWEINYGLFRYNFNGDLGAVQNYVSGLFNQFATMFVNEGIDVELSESYVWTVPDPYRNNSSSDGLDDFVNHWRAQGNNFNGDLAHLLAGGRENNGGNAFLNFDGICDKNYAYGYSNVYGYYNSYPTYSWDLNVIMHEIGHNLGSNHTHWCGWNTGLGGSCGAIDNCGYPESSSSCASCNSTFDKNISGWQGTIMSYCHLINGIGNNFIYGYGILPNSAIQDGVMASNCLVNTSQWTGAIDSLWERSENWSCANVPDSNTHVVLDEGVSTYPVIQSDARVASLTSNIGSVLKVNSNYSLLIKPASQKSNIIPLPSTGQLFITGNATQAGWMITGDSEPLSQKFTQLNSGVFILTNIYLIGGKSYLFVPTYGDWSDKFGYVGTANTNNTTKAPFMQLGQDIASPFLSGYYNIYVDFNTGFFTVNPAYAKVIVPASSELYITGGATVAGWMNSGDVPVTSQKFVQVSSTLYELSSIYLTGNSTFLFVPIYGNWNSKYGGLSGVNNSNNPNGDLIDMNGSDLITPFDSGNYKITVNFQTGRYSLIKL